MKCFLIDRGVIVPGLPVNLELHRPSVEFDGRIMQLSDDFLTNTCQLVRVMKADLAISENRLFTLEPETKATENEALVVLTTIQSTGGLNIALDGMLGTDQVLYHKNRVQAELRLQGETVRFSTTTVAARLLPGQVLTVHATYTKRIKLPFPRSLGEMIERWREGPQYDYISRVQECYRFDGTSMESTIDRMGN